MDRGRTQLILGVTRSEVKVRGQDRFILSDHFFQTLYKFALEFGVTRSKAWVRGQGHLIRDLRDGSSLLWLTDCSFGFRNSRYSGGQKFMGEFSQSYNKINHVITQVTMFVINS